MGTGNDEMWEYLERQFLVFAASLGAYHVWWWPSTLSLLEFWWILVGFIGVLVSAYDIWRAQQEFQYPWLQQEQAERGVSVTSLVKSLVLGTASALNLTAGIVVANLPPGQSSVEGVAASAVVVICLIVVEILIVVVATVRDIERVFVRRFVWTARKKTQRQESPAACPSNPPIHLEVPPIDRDPA